MVLLYVCSTVCSGFDLSKLNWPVAWLCYQIIARSTNNKGNPPLDQHAKWRHVHMTLKSSAQFCIFTIDYNPHSQMFELKNITQWYKNHFMTSHYVKSWNALCITGLSDNWPIAMNLLYITKKTVIPRFGILFGVSINKQFNVGWFVMAWN